MLKEYQNKTEKEVNSITKYKFKIVIPFGKIIEFINKFKNKQDGRKIRN